MTPISSRHGMIYRRWAYTKESCNSSVCATSESFAVESGKDNLEFGEFVRSISFTLLGSPMFEFIGTIVSLCVPPKIFKSVIGGITIVMARTQPLWAFPSKGSKYDSVDCLRGLYTATMKVDNAIAPRNCYGVQFVWFLRWFCVSILGLHRIDIPKFISKISVEVWYWFHKASMKTKSLFQSLANPCAHSVRYGNEIQRQKSVLGVFAHELALEI